MISEFFAVTLTSIYHVTVDDSGNAVAMKIALKGKSEIGIGHRLGGGTMLAVGDRLLAYVPEGGGITSYERNPEKVNTKWWGDMSSGIVALFKAEQEAFACFKQSDLKPYDGRWVEQGLAVLQEIGDDHPAFYICRSGHFALPLPVLAATSR